jgi:hypothetical protein
MGQNPSASETISMDFDKFLRYVDRRFQDICGLSINDVEDFDFHDYYPGETAKKIEYAQAVQDAARDCLSNAAGDDVASYISPVAEY